VTRTWRMFAGRPERVVDGREFLGFGDERTVRFRAYAPVPIELAEDTAGSYYGWLPTGADVPLMVQPHAGWFRIQSPDGFQQDVARGLGEIVRMTCRAID
jgi:hypothetical protein